MLNIRRRFVASYINSGQFCLIHCNNINQKTYNWRHPFLSKCSKTWTYVFLRIMITCAFVTICYIFAGIPELNEQMDKGSRDTDVFLKKSRHVSISVLMNNKRVRVGQKRKKNQTAGQREHNHIFDWVVLVLFFPSMSIMFCIFSISGCEVSEFALKVIFTWNFARMQTHSCDSLANVLWWGSKYIYRIYVQFALFLLFRNLAYKHSIVYQITC